MSGIVWSDPYGKFLHFPLRSDNKSPGSTEIGGNSELWHDHVMSESGHDHDLSKPWIPETPGNPRKPPETGLLIKG